MKRYRQEVKDMIKFEDVIQALEAVVAEGRLNYPSSFTISYIESFIKRAKDCKDKEQEAALVLEIRNQCFRISSIIPGGLKQDCADYHKLFLVAGQYLDFDAKVEAKILLEAKHPWGNK